MRLRRLAVLAACALALLVAVEVASAAPIRPSEPAATVRAKKKRCVLKRKATCRKAVVKGQKVGKVSLKGANLRGATISKTTFSGTNLTRVSFQGATLRNVTFRNADLGAATFKGAVLDHVRFEGADFGGPGGRCLAVPSSGGVSGKADCVAYMSFFRDARISNTAFIRTDLSKSDFRYARIDNTLFLDCDLDGSIFEETTWTRGSEIASSHNGSGSPARSTAQYAVFDGSSGVTIASRVDISYASFLGTRDATLLPSGVYRAGTRGPDATLGSFAVGFAETSGVVEDGWVEISEQSRLQSGLLWAKTSCSTAAVRRCAARGLVAAGGYGRIEFDAGTALKAVGPGVTCGSPTLALGGKWNTVCHGPIGEDTNVAITAAATPVRTVTISRMGFGASTPEVWIVAYAVGGVAMYEQHCPAGADTACSLDVPSGASVGVRAVSTSADWWTLICPGDSHVGTGARGETLTCATRVVTADVTGEANTS